MFELPLIVILAIVAVVALIWISGKIIKTVILIAIILGIGSLLLNFFFGGSNTESAFVLMQGLMSIVAL